jgi:hypothetical protein
VNRPPAVEDEPQGCATMWLFMFAAGGVFWIVFGVWLWEILG